MPAGYGGQSQQRWGDNTLNASETMRDLLLTDTTGEPRSTAQARRAGMLVLAFFKTTCPDCGTTFSHLQKLADAYGESGKLSVWGVSQDDAAATRAFAEAQGIRFPLLLDRELWHSMTYGIVSLPTIYLTDSAGVVRQKVVGRNPAALNAISEQIAAFLEREPVPIVDAGESATAVTSG